ncbi:hypothetical protein [Amycolatopsis sp. TNS106]|uniref:hypothetical protein n=1 Tax=Amycolatopsis sp. TNS106 TaxID=2861750 RepID=UPI001C57FD6C|nr:hypothetical protein [Amycolatopsis sp. TNS106]QXV63545.1 hypothetical protein CVV72_41015 [Amycolatopsis sp. TNS106]
MSDDEAGPTVMTAGQLRELLADIPPDLPIGVLTPNGDTCVVTSAAFGTVDWGRGAGPQTENRYLLLDTATAARIDPIDVIDASEII